MALAHITNTTCGPTQGTSVIIAGKCPVAVPECHGCQANTCCFLWAMGDSVGLVGGRVKSGRGRVYCVLSDRKYQVIFCNFSTLPIDLWLAAAMAFYCHAALPDAHFALFAKQKASQVSVVLPQ